MGSLNKQLTPPTTTFQISKFLKALPGSIQGGMMSVGQSGTVAIEYDSEDSQEFKPLLAFPSKKKMFLSQLREWTKIGKDWLHEAIEDEEEQKLCKFDPMTAASAASATFTVLAKLAPTIQSVFGSSKSVKSGLTKLKNVIGLPGKNAKVTKQLKQPIKSVKKKVKQVKKALEVDLKTVSLEALSDYIRDNPSYKKLSAKAKKLFQNKLNELRAASL
jgi:hypothetical protein